MTRRTKKQITVRLNENLLNRIDTYLKDMNKKEDIDKRGTQVKKVDIFETALFEYMEKIENEKE